MHPRKYNSLYKKQTSTAKRILNVVPIKEAWSLQQVYHELRRQGTAYTWSVFQGALASLIDDGLVIPKGQNVTRVQVAASTKTPVCEQQEAEPVDKKPETPASSPLTVDAALRQLNDLRDSLLDLASDWDTAIAELSNALDRNQERYAKLRQLSSLLKDLD